VYASGQGPNKGCCERGNEFSGSINNIDTRKCLITEVVLGSDNAVCSKVLIILIM
jgi:hypothetical protein